MAKTTPKRKHILRNIFLMVAAIPVLFILYIICTLLLSPVFDAADKVRFEKLDSQSRDLYAQLQGASGGAELWTYKATCEDMNRGAGGYQTTSNYSCETTLNLQLPVTSVQQLSVLHDKYFSIIDGSRILKPLSDLDKQLPGDFGVKFVSSSAEKEYVSSEGNMKCTYLADLSDGKTINYGVELSAENAVASISLRCTDKARGNWYAE